MFYKSRLIVIVKKWKGIYLLRHSKITFYPLAVI